MAVAFSMPHFSDYIVYVDESGDHGLGTVDEAYPIFVLAFCLFSKAAYVEECLSSVTNVKFKYVGHDQFVLHEREIRRQIGPFRFLRGDAERRRAFMADLTDLIARAPFSLVAVVIDKRELHSSTADNPYHIALRLGLEELDFQLREAGCSGGTLHVVFEQRGKKEDAELELEFRRLCATPGADGPRHPFGFVLANKRGNSTGLQLADLVARPVGMSVLRPEQANRTWDVLRPKFRSGPNGEVEGAGLRVFPARP